MHGLFLIVLNPHYHSFVLFPGISLTLTEIKPTGVSDTTIVLSAAKAKELKIKDGMMVALVGRRRRACYVRVSVASGKQKKTKCTISANVAANLRLRNGDKVKVERLEGETPEDTKRSGDMVLVQVTVPPKVMSVTLSPLEDSLNALEAGEGGDEIPDEELNQRFVAPYLEEKGALVKRDHVLTLRDDNGKKLDFIVTDVTLEGDEEKEEDAEGMCCGLFCVLN